MILCNKCHARLQAGFAVCPSCGTPVDSGLPKGHVELAPGRVTRRHNIAGLVGFLFSICIITAPIGLIVSLIGLRRRPREFAIAGAIVGLLFSPISLSVCVELRNLVVMNATYSTVEQMVGTDATPVDVHKRLKLHPSITTYRKNCKTEWYKWSGLFSHHVKVEYDNLDGRWVLSRVSKFQDRIR